MAERFMNLGSEPSSIMTVNTQIPAYY